MSYGVSNNVSRASNATMDLISSSVNNTYSVGAALSIDGTTTLTGVAISANKVVISSGASYLLEYSGQAYDPDLAWVGSVQWYNETLSQYIGSPMVIPVASGMFFYTARITRLTARALITAEDFGANATMTLYPRVLSSSSSGTTITLPGSTYLPRLMVIRVV